MSPRIKPVIAFAVIIFLVIAVGGAFKLLGRNSAGVNPPTTIVDPAVKCDYGNPDKSYVSQNAERCVKKDFSCKDGEKSFANECGCGCDYAKDNGNKACAKEGEEASWMPQPEGDGLQCCEGLASKEISTIADGKCNAVVDASVCVSCPNGTCGPGENKCNCPEDCGSDLTDCEKAGGKDEKLTECDGSISDVCDFSGENVCYVENLKNGKCTGIFSPKVFCDVDELPEENDEDIE